MGGRQPRVPRGASLHGPPGSIWPGLRNPREAHARLRTNRRDAGPNNYQMPRPKGRSTTDLTYLDGSFTLSGVVRREALIKVAMAQLANT
jgi:hypothetical protein